MGREDHACRPICFVQPKIYGIQDLNSLKFAIISFLPPAHSPFGGSSATPGLQPTVGCGSLPVPLSHVLLLDHSGWTGGLAG